MAYFKEAPDLRSLAQQVINNMPGVAHVDTSEVLFVRELETTPKALARCYSISEHPIGVFTPCRFAIVFYHANLDGFTDKQKALIMWHELMHIPPTGNKLVDHDVKDFYAVLGVAGIDWSHPGTDVPDILQGEGKQEIIDKVMSLQRNK